MIVEIIKSNSNFPKVGEFYKAKQYRLDGDKVTLIYQVDPLIYEKLKKQYCECSDEDPLINEYWDNVKYVYIPKKNIDLDNIPPFVWPWINKST